MKNFVAAIRAALTLGLALLTITSQFAQAQLSVGEGGQPNYSVPIPVPPGIADMEPQLSLQYGGDWSVAGLSVISRCGAIPATDGMWGGVRYNGDDKLCMDGQRLILTNDAGNPPTSGQGGYLAGAAEYRLEKDNFSRVRAYGGNATTGPAYFKVWTKSGLVYEYGNTVDSRITALTKNAVWAVNKVSDAASNFMLFSYEQTTATLGGTAGTDWAVSRIRYTGNGSQAPTFKVEFAYEARPDVRESYQYGSKTVTDRRLAAVRTYVATSTEGSGGVKVNTLKLGYSQSATTGNSLVTSIKSCAGAAETSCMPAAEFTYAPGSDFGYTFSQPSSLTGLAMKASDGKKGVIMGDFNGDGKQDFIRWDNVPANNVLMLSNGDGTFSASSAFNLTNVQLGKDTGCYYTRVADFNLDGVSDILLVADRDFNGNGANCEGVSTSLRMIFLGSTTGAFSNSYPVNLPLIKRVANWQANTCLETSGDVCIRWGPYMAMSGRNFHLADVNADGVIDIVATRSLPGAEYENAPTPCSPGELTCIFIGSRTAIGTYTKISTTLANEDIYSPDDGGLTGWTNYKDQQVFIGDMTGDGLPDILVRDKELRYIATGPLGAYEKHPDPSVPCASGREVLDINGDGKWDAACLDLNAVNSFKAYVNDGTGHMIERGPVANWASRPADCPDFGPPTEYPPPLTCNPDDFNAKNVTYLAADLNGDGIGDILAIGRHRNANGSNVNAVAKGNRDGSFTIIPTAFDGTLMGWEYKTDVLLGDFRGKGVPDFLRISEMQSSNGIFLRTHTGPQDVLASVKSSTGEVTNINYKHMTDSTVYTKGSGAEGQMVDVLGTGQLVSSISQPDGIGGTAVTTFAYGGLRANLAGRGAAGFLTKDTTNSSPDGDLTARVVNRQDFPYAGLPVESRLFYSSVGPSAWMNLSTSEYADLRLEACPMPGTPTIHRTVLRQKSDKRRAASAGGPEVQTITTNSGFACVGGEPGYVEVTTIGDSKTFTKATGHTYAPPVTSGDSWRMGRLLRSDITSTVPGAIAATSAGLNPIGTGAYSPNPAVFHRDTPGVLTASLFYNNQGWQMALSNVWTTSPGSRISVSNVTTSTMIAGGTATLVANVGWGENIQEVVRVKSTNLIGEVRTVEIPVTFTTPAQPALSLSSQSPLLLSRTTDGTASAAIGAIAIGGTPPYTFGWARLSGSRLSFASSGATNTFAVHVNGTSGTFTETFRVSSTDSASVIRTLDFVVVTSGPSNLSVTLSLPSPQEHYDVEPPWSVIEEITATATGGVAPYTYRWDVISGRSGGSLIATSLAWEDGDTNIVEVPVSWGDSFTDTIRVTVTDSLGTQRFTDLQFIANGLYAE